MFTLLQSKEVRISSVNLTEPQRALLGYISAGQDVLIRADEELRTKVINYFIVTIFHIMRFQYPMLLYLYFILNRLQFKSLAVICAR